MKRHKTTIYITIILCLILTVISSIFYYRTSIRTLITEKSQDDLRDYTNQSVELFNYVVEDYLHQLDVMAELSVHVSQEGKDELMRLIQEINQEKPYLNFSLVDRDGIMYNGKQILDIHDKPSYLRAMKGEQVISKVYKNELNESDAILFAIPIYDDEAVVGVAELRYEITAFMSLIGNSQFQGNGATMIMAEDGTMVSGHEGLEQFATLYEALSEFTFEDEYSLDQMKERVQNGQDGFLRYSKQEEDRYLYYQPIGKEGWYMVSLVMAEGLYAQYNEISNIAYALLFVNVVLFGFILVFIYLTVRELRSYYHENQRDPLTKTYNKISAKALSERILREHKELDLHACFFLDIDNFKSVNDTYGHNAGDEIILHLAMVLNTSFRSSDIITRFGGDEFFVLMRNVRSKEYIEQKARLLLKQFADNACGTHLSIGISMFPEDGRSYEELLRHADEALYEAKRKGKNTYAFYTKDESLEAPSQRSDAF